MGEQHEQPALSTYWVGVVLASGYFVSMAAGFIWEEKKHCSKKDS